ncbi:sensor histidine kinase [Persicobacter psychrovividus]|uniref:Histidine kinase n=1 Tax=Persicobacter psychrovividus TaxID=387638 RepID=A0ABN6LAA5_9BACT|nr:histidine kinase [Persicobacter psychrovividus]
MKQKSHPLSQHSRLGELIGYSVLLSLYFLIMWSFFAQRLPNFLSAYKAILIIVGMTIVIAINIKYLIPHFLHDRKWWLYFGGALLAVVVVSYIYNHLDQSLMEHYSNLIDRREMRRYRRPKSNLSYPLKQIVHYTVFPQFMQFLLVLFLSTAFEMTKYAFQKSREAVALREQTLQSELNFLKSQINPHFLFNALNNIYTLAYLKSDKAPEMILKLSDMLRYILYDCKAELVPVDREVQYLQDYIQLQLLKSERPLDIELQLQTPLSGATVPPMIFIPFVENAFKHSKIEDKQGWIRINLFLEAEALIFRVENSKPSQPFRKDNVGGIGLRNVERRLSLLYPNSHQLEVEDDQDRFLVHLSLNLPSKK